jgi:hypothetical protein
MPVCCLALLVNIMTNHSERAAANFVTQLSSSSELSGRRTRKAVGASNPG